MSSTPNPLRLNADWLASVGLAELAPDLADRFLAAAYQRLESRVGVAIAATLTADELEEFAALLDRDDTAGALAWLDAHCPHHRDIVGEHLAAVTAEVRSRAAAILAAVAHLEATSCR